MIKRFCDRCSIEITATNLGPGGITQKPLLASIGELEVKVTVFKNGVADTGDYCKYCVIDVIKKLDDRKLDCRKY